MYSYFYPLERIERVNFSLYVQKDSISIIFSELISGRFKLIFLFISIPNLLFHEKKELLESHSTTKVVCKYLYIYFYSGCG